MRLLILLSLIAVSPKAFAEPVAQFRANATRVLQGATPSCLAITRDLSHEKILKSVADAPVTASRIEVGGRTGALWTNGGINYDPDLYAQMSELGQAVLSLHEFTGHAQSRYIDDGYSFSMYLALCSKAEYATILGKIVWPKAYVSKRFILERQGGSTVVGGGGDGRDIELKLEAIEILMRMYNKGEQRFLDREIPEIIRGILFVNFYRSEKSPKEHFNLYIPRGPDREFQAVVLVHPETFNTLLQSALSVRIMQVAKLGIFFSDHVLSK